MFCREVFVLLEESKFEVVLGEVRQRIASLARSFVSTNIVEESFNELQSRQGTNKRKEISRRTRWSTLRASNLLEEYDRPPPARTAASDSSAAKSLPNELFESKLADYCQGAAELMTISTAKGWAHLGPEAWNNLPLLLERFMVVGADTKALKSSWLSLALQEGCALKRADSDTAYLILKVTPWGALLWPLVRDDRTRTLTPQSASSAARPLQVHVPTDPDKYKVCHLRAIPQCSHRKYLHHVKAQMSGIKLTVVGAPSPLLTFAAHSCFRGLDVPHLRALHVQLIGGSAADRPSTERELLKCLLRHILPAASDEEIDRLLSLRKSAQCEQDVCSTVLNDEGMKAALENCVDEDGHSEFKRVMANLKVAASAAKPQSSSSAPRAAASSSSTAKPAVRPRPKKFPDARSCTPSWARQFLPQATGANLCIDEVRHMRWVAEYRNKKDPPRSHTATFGDETCVSRRQALLKALRWQWSVPTAEIGEQCPWDLSS